MATRRDPSRPPAVPGLEIRLTGDERYQPTLHEIGLFFSDLAILFELYRKGGSDDESVPYITRFDWYRDAIRVAPEERLWLRGLKMQSPLDLIVVSGILLMHPQSIDALVNAASGLRNLVHLPADMRKRNAEADQAVASVARIEAEAEKIRADARLVHAQARKAEIEAELLERGDETIPREIARIEFDEPRRLAGHEYIGGEPRRLTREEDSRKVIARVRHRVLDGPVRLSSFEVNAVPDISVPASRRLSDGEPGPGGPPPGARATSDGAADNGPPR